MEGNKQSRSFTSGPILTPLIAFTLPVLLSLFLQALYGAVDLIVVSRYLGAAEISAVAAGGNVIHMMQLVIAGLAMGVTVVIGRCIGEEHFEEASRFMGVSIAMFAVLGIVLSVVMTVSVPWIARAMDMPAEAYGPAVDYLTICCGGLIFVVGYNLLSCIFRGIGNSIMPLVFVAIAAVVNVVGDIVLVTKAGMGVKGVAVATIGAQAVSVVLSVIIIRRTELPFRFSVRQIGFERRKIKEVLGIGIPVALKELVTQLSFLALNTIANGMGLIMSAGYGIAMKTVSFSLLIPVSFMQSMSAFIAQNMGAGKQERAKKTMYYGWGLSVGIGVVMFWFVHFHGDVLAAVFTSDTEVIAAAASYLKGFAIDCIQVGILFCYIGFYNGCCRTGFVLFQSIWDSWVVRIPAAYLLSHMTGATLFHLSFATPIATASTIVVSTIYYLMIRKHIFVYKSDGFKR